MISFASVVDKGHDAGEIFSLSGTFEPAAVEYSSASQPAVFSNSTSVEGNSTEEFSELKLNPGQTSLQERVRNLIAHGHPMKAIALLDTALNNAEENGISNMLEFAMDAQYMLEQYGYRGEASLLNDILSPWTGTAEPQRKAEFEKLGLFADLERKLEDELRLIEERASSSIDYSNGNTMPMQNFLGALSSTTPGMSLSAPSLSI